MPRYLSQHTLVCLTRQGAAELVRHIHTSTGITVKRVLLNMQEGKMLIELEAPNRDEIEKWFMTKTFHFDWLLLIEFESVDGKLYPT